MVVFMAEDKSIDILGAKPLAKAVEKVTDKSVDGLSAFLSAICMPAAEEFGLLLRDKVAGYRRANLEKIARKASEAIRKNAVEVSGETNPRVVHQIVEEASWAEDETLQSMWVGLLLDAASRGAEEDDSIIYIDLIKRLTVFQARIINMVYGDPRAYSVNSPVRTSVQGVYPLRNPLVYSSLSILEVYPGDLARLKVISGKSHEEILKDKQSAGLVASALRPQIEALKDLGLFYNVEYAGTATLLFTPCVRGLDLYMRCEGQRLYPIEAYLLVKKSWMEQKGLDPFTYRPTRLK